VKSATSMGHTFFSKFMNNNHCLHTIQHLYPFTNQNPTPRAFHYGFNSSTNSPTQAENSQRLWAPGLSNIAIEVSGLPTWIELATQYIGTQIMSGEHTRNRAHF